MKPIINMLIEYGVSAEDIEEKLKNGYIYVELVKGESPIKPYIYFTKTLSLTNRWGSDLIGRFRLIDNQATEEGLVTEMVNRFNLLMLKTICFSMNWYVDDFPNTRTEFARELVERAVITGRLDDLLLYARRENPFFNWKK